MISYSSSSSMSIRMLAAGLAHVLLSICVATKPHLIMVLQDDLGHFDTGITNANRVNVTGNITKLAREGVILENHYVHYWCSPTRRSFLSGRLPLHHGEQLSGYATDDLDLRWNLISQKLQSAGYQSYWYGKGHTGYKSMNHLPTRRGFKNFTGFLHGRQDYRSNDRWQNEAPFTNTTYSTTLYGDKLMDSLNAHNPKVPIFMYLPWQAVHAPHEAPDDWTGDVYEGMLFGVDGYMGRLVSLLKQKGMWNNTLLVYSADNGGTAGGNNYPLRGYKRTNWEGGMRVQAFVSGGLIPKHLRGTTNKQRFHIVDWYPTFCELAGVEPTDDSPTPPLPIDPSDPTQDIYGNASYPGIDGTSVWKFLTRPDSYPNISSAHPSLILTREVIIKGKYKLLVAERGDTHQPHYSYENGWEYPNGTWVQPAANYCGRCDGVSGCGNHVGHPCLFDLESDPREEHDLWTEMPKLGTSLWAELNNSWLGAYLARSPEGLLGACNVGCAKKHWKAQGSKFPQNAPWCDVPGCSQAEGP